MPESVAGQVKSLRSSLDLGTDATRQLYQWVYDNVTASDVLPREIGAVPSALLQRLGGALESACRAARDIEASLWGDPVERFIKGFLLSREEYYLLAACGLVSYTCKSAGLCDYDDYDILVQFHYEDDERCCYINPTLEPRVPGFISMRIGVAPEEISWHRLRSDQRAFFEQKLPEIAARFGREI
jgi:hypothetical protein